MPTMVATNLNRKSSFEAGSSRSWIAWDISSDSDVSGCVIAVRANRREMNGYKQVTPLSYATRFDRNMPSMDNRPAPRTINTNIPPAIARSFSKCRSSLRLAKFV
jgi:hypothetical protein